MMSAAGVASGVSDLALEVIGLRKAYGDHIVLDDLHLAVAAGSVYALLGPNGAGKTTTVEIMSTLTPPDGGEVWVAGHRIDR
jgi:ABC-2 type transport system ATP-binding protein